MTTVMEAGQNIPSDLGEGFALERGKSCFVFLV